jgi:hypothetical protein
MCTKIKTFGFQSPVIIGNNNLVVFNFNESLIEELLQVRCEHCREKHR